jgi:hypothetical protein
MASAGSNIVGSSSIMSRPVRASEPGGLSPWRIPAPSAKKIELAAFGGLRAAHVVLDLQRAVGRNVRMAPGGRVVAMAADRHSDTHLALVHADPSLLKARLKHAALRDAIL